MVVGVVTTVLSLGVSMTAGEVLAPLRRWALVGGLVVVNCVAVPVVAWALTSLMPLTQAQGAALILTSAGAGGAAGLKAAQLARVANLPLALSLVILLQVLNLASLPVWIRIALPGAEIPTGSLLAQLIGLILLPLAVALWLRARRPSVANAAPALVRIGNVAVGLALVTGVIGSWTEIVTVLGSWVIPCSLLIIVAGAGLGAVVAGRDSADATTAALVSGMRFAALALVLISRTLDNDAEHLAPALVYSLLDLGLAIAAGLWLGRRAGGRAATLG